MFYSGQKVVCIDDQPRHGGRLTGIVKGRTYTVRWSGHYEHPFFGDAETCLRFFEVRRPVPFEPDLPFAASRFRPLCSRPTSIAVFEALLAPSAPSVLPTKERT